MTTRGISGRWGGGADGWRVGLLLAVVALSPLRAAERVLDFAADPVNEPPPGFRSAVSGEGQPGDWRVIRESLSGPADGQRYSSSVRVERAVLAQLARDRTDEHFPLLIDESGSYSDFRFSTRFKTVAGDVEQMAGIAFRVVDEQNYYVLRASTMGDSFLFYKFLGGLRSVPRGVNVELSTGEWHEMAVECKGNQIRCFLDGKERFSVNDNSFTTGRIGFWTKSDSVSYFTEAKIRYTPQETLAEALIREAMEAYPKVLGLKIYARTPGRSEVHVIASTDPEERGKAGGDVEEDVVKNGNVYYGKDKGEVTVTMPLRDRNGDPVAAARLVLRRVAGQTRDDALSRARRVYQVMRGRILDAEDLWQ